MRKRDNHPKQKRTAQERANDLLSYSMGFMAVIMGLAPIHQWIEPGFDRYISRYYGDGFAGIASIFLLVLLALLIFSAATLLMHIMASIFEGRSKLWGILTRF